MLPFYGKAVVGPAFTRSGDQMCNRLIVCVPEPLREKLPQHKPLLITKSRLICSETGTEILQTSAKASAPPGSGK